VSPPRAGGTAVTIHGRTVAFRREGPRGAPALLLVHGIAGNRATWDEVVPRLAADHDVIALDLPGHGASDPPIGDYSTGAYACVLRDLLEVLEVDAATIVGHSLGGGVTMQFAYQFPELMQRMVLVNSGGLGREVSALVRSASLPGSELVIPLLASAPVRLAGRLTGQALRAIGRPPSVDQREAGAALGGLADAETRRAFIGTVRSLMDVRGQRVSATNRLYLADAIPTLIVWGARDSILPVAHGREAAEAMPASRLEVFEDSGHFPHVDRPDRFAELLAAFVADTPASTFDRAHLRRLLLTAH
jgi:pimeloyl-ACP methyl ester carboxylesterase